MRWLAITALLTALATVAPATAQQQQPGSTMRTFAGFRLGGGYPETRDFGTGGSFETDPKIANGYLVGPVMSYQRREISGSVYQDGRDANVNQFISGIRAAYGRGPLETGLLVPYIQNKVNDHDDRSGFGDVQFYGKVAPIQLDGFDAAAGMTMILPSGNENKQLGYGEVGFLPFGSAALHIPGNPLEVRGMFGYRFFADDHTAHRADDPSVSIGHAPAAAWVYRGGLLITPNDGISLKLDFTGESIDISGASQPMALEPAVELRIPTSTLDVLIQPTGLVGLNGEAPSWGIGIGFAVTGSSQAERARKAQPF